MKKIWHQLKPYLRWVILGVTLFFLGNAFKDHWQEVAAIEITGTVWLYGAIALLLTFLAHLWAGWVWGAILRLLKQSVKRGWVLRVYLKTNIAKYLPGNVWHFYGRVWAVKAAGISLSAATISIVLEPLLMVAGALAIALAVSQLGWLASLASFGNRKLQVLGLGIVLLGMHPRILNPVMQQLSRLKAKNEDVATLRLEGYPWFPLLGEIGFILLRGAGFIFVALALAPVNLASLPLLLGAFSFAWCLGLVIPTPGGLGVFETTAIALLDQHFSAGIILSVVAVFRLISLVAEATAAGLAWLGDFLAERRRPTAE
ncbi:MAG: hypothetical protein BRC59_11610 [Cyanobacteria bacterium SW_4_48_29]|jgi:uncharacterized membrane protein YbhN (UPF0104 family)|nr:MAG: hypothetical protein BRC59_11610 [Cyanobacteria bacterium SW_4_48_29]